MKNISNLLLTSCFIGLLTFSVLQAESNEKSKQSNRTIGKGSIVSKRMALTFAGRFHTHQLRINEIQRRNSK